jgi:hypothetical protein
VGVKVQTDADKEALFKQFQAWEAEKNARAQAQVRPAREVRPARAEKKERSKD